MYESWGSLFVDGLLVRLHIVGMFSSVYCLVGLVFDVVALWCLLWLETLGCICCCLFVLFSLLD